MHRFNIDFMGNRRIMFAISAVLLVVSIGALAIRGLTFGIEFTGGTVINVVNAERRHRSSEMRKAFADAGIANAQRPGAAPSTACAGFIVRTEVTDPQGRQRATRPRSQRSTELPSGDVPGHDDRSRLGQERHQQRRCSRLAVSLLAILLYVSLRFEYKMSVTAIVALVHDILITLGIYALVGLGGHAERRSRRC